MMKKLFVAVLAITMIIGNASAVEEDETNTLKCLVKYLKSKGISEDFFDSVSSNIDGAIDCEFLTNVKLTRAYGKIHDKLKADSFFNKYAPCIMNSIKTDANKVIILQREAIKINGLGIKVWNYFSQKEHLDELQKKIESSVNKAASEKCVSVY